MFDTKFIIYFPLLMESDSESSISYSQQEVIWAKIQGHPWWPAFIDQVHRDNGGKTQYTVNFFGDNPSSRLGASKLNKFQEFYAEHYPKARTHRKLMASLKLAQQTIKENEQDIQVFADIRQELKQKRRWETKVTQIGRVSSSLNDSNQIEELPKLKKARSWASRSKAQAEKNQNKSSEIKGQRLKRNRSLPASKQAHWTVRYPRKFAEDASQVQSFYNNQSIVYQEHNKIYDELQQQPLSDDFQRNRLKKDKITKKARQIPISNRKPRKRGRPRKIITSEILNYSKENDESNHFQFCRSSKRKIIYKRTSTGKFSFKSLDKSLSKDDAYIIENTRKLMKNRVALIEYLSDISITIRNVQQILELGVIERLREGDDYKQVQDIISMLMNTLILKYFPNDNKPKGSSFENIQRKKRKAANAEKSLELNNERHEQEVKEKNCLSGEECRKKTVLKLQKYLSRNSESLKDSSIRDISIQIETMFFAEDRFIGQRYKRLALKALIALKEGSITPLELIRRLKEKKMIDV